MEVNDVAEMTIADFFNMCENEGGTYQIDTPEGWQDINFLVRKKNKECVKLTTNAGYELECSSSHEVLTERGWKCSKEIDINLDWISTRNGMEQVVGKEFIGVKDTFDLQVNSDKHRYFSNDIVSHNCGKSLVCKAISSVWESPLLRLDFGRLFGSLVGDSEKNAREAIRQAEAIAPCVLWIDEIEKAISGNRSSGSTDGGTTSRVLGTFLTWMQEKKSSVFVVATANDHASIPPEFLRAGRFDEIFFVDLPNITEREEIFEILLRLRGIDTKNMNIPLLAQRSDKFSGAEIEKGIDNAMLTGFRDGRRAIVTDDIINAMSQFKSLYKMRTSDFEELREWASLQCRSANLDESLIVNPAQNDKTRDLDL